MKNVILTVVTTLLSLTVSAQKAGKDDRIKALKTAYITQEMKLSSSDAELFWPIYNKIEEQKYNLRKESKQLQVAMNEISESPTAKEDAEELLSQLLQLYQKEQKIKMSLISELKKNFDAEFVVELKRAEYKFKMQLLKKYRAKEK
ncbi:MAG TPA: hypothetical protein VFD80_00965 [Flavobacteriaceae bacterium]|nr:hypothetical protein [Flavobacteriaceae bacterium]